MGLLDSVKSFAGDFVDVNAHVGGALLDTVGLHDAAHAVDKWGDGIADDLGAAVGELNLGDTDDPKELVHGDTKAIGDSVTHLNKFATAFEETASGLSRMDSDHWQGKAADAFRRKFGNQPTAWRTTADACTAAAKALDALSHTIEWAQGEAQQAIDLYTRAEQASKDAKDAYNSQVHDYNSAVTAFNQASSAGQNPTPPTRPADFVDAGADGRKQAGEKLFNARKARAEAAHTAETALKAATTHAPKKAGFWDEVGMALQDAPTAAGLTLLHVDAGVVKGAADLVKFGRGLNPYDVYNLTHPAAYADHLNSVATGLIHTANHPTELLSAIVGSGWGSDPGEAGGKALFNLVSGVATGGGSEAAAVGERLVIDSAENAAKNEAVHAGESVGEKAVADAAEHPVDPVPAHVPEPEPDRLAAAADRNVDIEGMKYKPAWRDGSEPLYRFDGRSPDKIFSSGFEPWNAKNTDLMGYASGNDSSAFVGTTRDPGIKLGEGKQYMYEVDAPGGIDVNATLGKASPYKEESEVAFPGGIKTDHIKGVRERLPDGSMGDLIPNPNYTPRVEAPPPAPAAPAPPPESVLPSGWTLPPAP